jgi:3-oxoacyl-[acyl-carrier-protein] synthase-1
LNVITQNKSSEIGHVLKTASGFGGSNASLIFGKENKSLNHRSSIGFNIINKVILSNDRLFFDNSEQPLDFVSPGHQSSIDFIKHLYKYSKIQYPKFFKMDILCKTAIMACEFLLRDNETFKKYASEEIAVILSNGSSSLNTDAEYQKSINDRTDYFPSPTVFVYTLPNIMVGEICIRHKIKGENSVFISKDFDKEFIFNYVKILFETEKAKACIAGRIDHHYPEGNIFAELYLIESNK